MARRDLVATAAETPKERDVVGVACGRIDQLMQAVDMQLLYRVVDRSIIVM
jgi:hypothetical protein